MELVLDSTHTLLPLALSAKRPIFPIIEVLLRNYSGLKKVEVFG
jgi:hypothetical protein